MRSYFDEPQLYCPRNSRNTCTNELCPKGAGAKVRISITNPNPATHRRTPVTPGHSATMGCRMPLILRRIAQINQPAQK